jgi:hypothetical protein
MNRFDRMLEEAVYSMNGNAAVADHNGTDPGLAALEIDLGDRPNRIGDEEGGKRDEKEANLLFQIRASESNTMHFYRKNLDSEYPDELERGEDSSPSQAAYS